MKLHRFVPSFKSSTPEAQHNRREATPNGNENVAVMHSAINHSKSIEASLTSDVPYRAIESRLEEFHSHSRPSSAVHRDSKIPPPSNYPKHIIHDSVTHAATLSILSGHDKMTSSESLRSPNSPCQVDPPISANSKSSSLNRPHTTTAPKFTSMSQRRGSQSGDATELSTAISTVPLLTSPHQHNNNLRPFHSNSSPLTPLDNTAERVPTVRYTSPTDTISHQPYKFGEAANPFQAHYQTVMQHRTVFENQTAHQPDAAHASQPRLGHVELQTFVPGSGAHYAYRPLPTHTPLPSESTLRSSAAQQHRVVDRRAMQPTPQTKTFSGLCFLIVVVHVIAFQYICYTVLVLTPMVISNPTTTSFVLAGIFNCIFAFTIWSFTQCVITDPGTVPPHWGFYMGDKNKRRRYCQVCNIWKPDRTHHCSACGRCVLNMDHHCPWINNCVGFFNRKFFIQLLLFALLSCICVGCHGFIWIIQRRSFIWPYGTTPRSEIKFIFDIVAYCLVCILILISFALALPMVPFFKFHLGLISENSTTIENMVESKQSVDRSRYDLGCRRNVEQVMGPNVCLWWLPVNVPQSRPVGDGVRWRQGYLSASRDEEA